MKNCQCHKALPKPTATVQITPCHRTFQLHSSLRIVVEQHPCLSIPVKNRTLSLRLLSDDHRVLFAGEMMIRTSNWMMMTSIRFSLSLRRHLRIESNNWSLMIALASTLLEQEWRQRLPRSSTMVWDGTKKNYGMIDLLVPRYCSWFSSVDRSGAIFCLEWKNSQTNQSRRNGNST